MFSLSYIYNYIYAVCNNKFLSIVISNQLKDSKHTTNIFMTSSIIKAIVGSTVEHANQSIFAKKKQFQKIQI